MSFMENKNYTIRKVRTSGTSLILDIPAGICREMKLTAGDYIKIYVENDKVEIEKTGL